MLYALMNHLYRHFESLSFLRLFNYITFRTILAAITAFSFSLFFGLPVIRYLKRKRIKDISRNFGQVATEGKSGTPTMGGIIIFSAVGLSALLWCNLVNRFVQLLLFALAWFAGMGFLDDYLKIKYDSKVGLQERYKLTLQGLFGLFLGMMIVIPGISPMKPGIATSMYLPFIKVPVLDMGVLYALFIMFVVVAISNSVNLADGLDGLAIVPSSFVAVVFGIFAYVIGNFILAQHFLFDFLPGAGEITIFCAGIFGAGLGFLWFNAYPAQVFMGDIGSLGLGGILATIAVLIKQEFLFLIAGGIFVAEATSVFLQKYIFIPRVKRRLFYRTPIHDTFKHRGHAETKVVIRFWIVAAILALISLSALKIR